MKTYATKKTDIKIEWRLIDAKGKVLGRLASDIANILMGKDKPYFTRSMVCGDKVVVINAKYIDVTGNKESGKVYYKHTGFIGNLKKETFENLQKRKPGEVIKRAVFGMLPKNRLRDKMLGNLYIYSDNSHPHQAQLKINHNG